MERGVREREQWEGATDKGKAYDSAYRFGDVASNTQPFRHNMPHGHLNTNPKFFSHIEGFSNERSNMNIVECNLNCT